MIPHDLEHKVVLKYKEDGWTFRRIAKEYRIHVTTVKRILSGRGFLAEVLQSHNKGMIVPFIPFIRQTFEKHPKMAASCLWQLCRDRGYKGGPDHFRAQVRYLRPTKLPEAYLALNVLPGEEAQVDWGCFGKVMVGQAERRLSCFVMVLSWSRKLHIEFFYDQKLHSFLEGHNNAFKRFGGVPKVILYDNLKSVVLERDGDAIRFNPEFMDYVQTVRFEPRPVGVRKGNEKGRVERAIRYVRDNFFAGREFRNLEDLNEQAEKWITQYSDERRCPQDGSLSVAQAHAIERDNLMKVIELPPPESVNIARVRKTPYITVDGNEYSVPSRFVTKQVAVRLSRDWLRVYYNGEKIAEHSRCYNKRCRIEELSHIEELRKYKALAGESSTKNTRIRYFTCSCCFSGKI